MSCLSCFRDGSLRIAQRQSRTRMKNRMKTRRPPVFVTVEEVLRLDTVRHQSAAELRREKIRAAKAREVRLIDGSIE